MAYDISMSGSLALNIKTWNTIGEGMDLNSQTCIMITLTPGHQPDFHLMAPFQGVLKHWITETERYVHLQYCSS